MSSQAVISPGDHLAWIVDRLGGLTVGSRDAVLRAVNSYFEQRTASNSDEWKQWRDTTISIVQVFARVARSLGVDENEIDSWAYLKSQHLQDLPDACIKRIAEITEENARFARGTKISAESQSGREFLRVSKMLGVDTSDNPTWPNLAERCLSTIATLRNHDAIKALNQDHDREELKLKTEIGRIRRELNTEIERLKKELDSERVAVQRLSQELDRRSND